MACGHAAKEHGGLNILVNSVGIAPVARIADSDLALRRWCQSIYVEGPQLGMRAALTLLIESGALRTVRAAVINIASAAANRTITMTAANCASKAMAMMTARCQV